MRAALAGGGGSGDGAWLPGTYASRTTSQQDHVGGQNKVTQNSTGPGHLPGSVAGLGGFGLVTALGPGRRDPWTLSPCPCYLCCDPNLWG